IEVPAGLREKLLELAQQTESRAMIKAVKTYLSSTEPHRWRKDHLNMREFGCSMERQTFQFYHRFEEVSPRSWFSEERRRLSGRCYYFPGGLSLSQIEHLYTIFLGTLKTDSTQVLNIQESYAVLRARIYSVKEWIEQHEPSVQGELAQYAREHFSKM
ncbi:MAG: hypothetical protein AAFX99_18255, partial [Myxococcota bacterium]